MSAKTLMEHLAEVDDPRIDRNKKHKLIDVMTIAVCAVVSGAEGWEHIEMFAKMKFYWLKSFLELPNGLPSHDTIARVFHAIDPNQFQNAFVEWVSGTQLDKTGKVIAIDGKSLMRSFDKANGKGPLHIVSAWAVDAGITLGQVKADEKPNEITAIPDLIKMLDLSGAIITIDAMGCQKKIARKILDKDADYVLALKDNHRDLHSEVNSLFKIADRRELKDMPYDTCTSINKDHGRIETRICTTLAAKHWMPDLEEWAGLKTFARIESTREINDSKQTCVRYYLSSLSM